MAGLINYGLKNIFSIPTTTTTTTNNTNLFSNKFINLNYNWSNVQPYQPSRYMAALKEVRNRMKSVQSIKKITASMKLVAAAKLRATQANLENTRAFTAELNRTLTAFDASDFVKVRSKKDDVVNTLVVPLTSDRGLCGSVNSTVVKEIKKVMKDLNEEKTSIIVVGEKARSGLKRDFGHKIQFVVKDTAKKPPVAFHDVIPIAPELVKLDWDKALFYYNKFVTILAFDGAKFELINYKKLFPGKFPYDDLTEFALAAQIYAAIAEHSAAELGARMSAMDSATRNAGAMLAKLTLAYNRRRQASITTELCEIIGGAEALKG